MKIKKAKWLFVALAIVMLVSLFSGLTGADEVPNYGFIPNSGEASVSKVDLANGTAVARYWTAPRSTDQMDALGNATPGTPFGVNPYNWRTARIAMDAGGNAWVINTGADGSNLQGTIVRIQGDADPSAINTNADHANPFIFGTDEAVQAFYVGGPGDIPRTAVFDSGGNLWVGFHMQNKKYGYFMKYQYSAGNLNVVGGPYFGFDVEAPEYDIAPYESKIDKNGIVWFASYGSSHLLRTPGATYGADNGMYSFDTNNPAGSLTKYAGITTGYGILIDNGGEGDPVKVYVTTLAAPHSLWMSEDYGDFAVVANWSTSATGFRGMSFDANGVIWIAASGNGRVAYYNPSNGTFGSYDGFGTTPVGVGRDAAGIMWVIQRGNNLIRGFDPANPAGDKTDISVGYRPYAYGDFVIPAEPPTYDICGYKYLAEDGECTDIAYTGGWEISLYKLVEDGDVNEPADWVLVVKDGLTNPVDTDAYGKYCFEGLLAGTYKVVEEARNGWTVVGHTYYVVELPDGATDPDDPDTFYNFCNEPNLFCGDDTVWAAEHLPGENRFVDQGNWGTYVKFDLDREGYNEDTPKAYPLYGGQHYLAGVLYAYADIDNNILYVKYNSVIPDEKLTHYLDKGGKLLEKEGYEDVEWAGLLEYHLHVVDELADFNAVRTTVGRLRTPGNPIPGQFKYKAAFDPAADDSGWIEVDITGFTGQIYIAAHGVMQWCGFVEEAYNEATAYGWNGNGF